MSWGLVVFISDNIFLITSSPFCLSERASITPSVTIMTMSPGPMVFSVTLGTTSSMIPTGRLPPRMISILLRCFMKLVGAPALINLIFPAAVSMRAASIVEKLSSGFVAIIAALVTFTAVS